MEDYSQLPEEIVEKITTEHLDTVSQLIAFSGVCTSWRSTALDSYNRRHRRQVPFLPGLLLSKTLCTSREPYCFLHHNYKEDSNCRRKPHHQFRPISTLFNGVPRRWSPPNFRTRRRMHLIEERDLEKLHCVASRDGWLVLANPAIRSFMDISPLKICLLNPVTGASITLPPLDQFRSIKLESGYTVLSSSPDYDDDCHVIILVHCYDTPQVAWCKVRGGCWKFTSKDFKLFNIVECATYFGGKLYVVDRADYVHVLSNLLSEETTSPPSFTVRSFFFSSAMRSPYLGEEYYPGERWTFYDLFELNGELIVILRHCYRGLVSLFRVYKLALLPASSDHCWEEVKSLDGYAVFLGTHQSLCVALRNDEIVKRNHIYYLNYSCGHCDFHTEHRDQEYWFHHSRDCGVYSLEHRMVVEHSRRNLYQDYVWFSPMPWDIRKQVKKRQTGPSASSNTTNTLCDRRFQTLSLLDDSDDC
ncbi:hypothetical protein LINPERPRIM_LOCUS23441 [Linum perenne]